MFASNTLNITVQVANPLASSSEPRDLLFPKEMGGKLLSLDYKCDTTRATLNIPSYRTNAVNNNLPIQADLETDRVFHACESVYCLGLWGMQGNLLFSLVDVDAQGVAQPFVRHLEKGKNPKKLLQ